MERVESGSMSKKHIEQTTTQTFWPELARRCVFCHDDIPSLLTRAHHHLKRVRSANRNECGIDDAYDLCWSCHHGLLHAGIIPERGGARGGCCNAGRHTQGHA